VHAILHPTFGKDDPSVRAGLNRFEIHRMRVSALDSLPRDLNPL